MQLSKKQATRTCERCGGSPAANTTRGVLCRSCSHEDWKKDQKQSHRKIAEPNAYGGGVAPMAGGGNSMGGGASGGQVNPNYTAGPSIAAPDGIGNWKCKFPRCRRTFSNGGDFRDHMYEDHDVVDIG